MSSSSRFAPACDKVLRLCLVIALVTGLNPGAAFAEAATEGESLQESGASIASTESDFTYSYSSYFGGATITGYTGSETEVVIPSAIDGYSVIAIGKNAFASNKSISSVSIPSSVTSIGEGAFAYCSSLETLLIPSGVQTIGSMAFFKCTSLVGVSLPGTITALGDYVFSDCYALESINIPSGVTSIPYEAFYECSSLKSIEIPSGVASIGQGAFHGCSALTSVVIPSSVTSLANYAFAYCSSLESVVIYEGVVSIGDYAFGYCDSLQTIQIPASATSVSKYTLWTSSSVEEESITVRCWAGSVAETFAKGYGYSIEYLTEFDFIEVEVENAVYTGEPVALNISVSYGGAQLKAGTDYNISCDSCVNAGDYEFTLEGAGDYAGASYKGVFTIAPADISDVDGLTVSDVIYTGSAIEPELALSFNSKVLEPDVDYGVSYADNVEAGWATVTVVGVGNFTGTVALSFQIMLPCIAFGETGNCTWILDKDGVLTISPVPSTDGLMASTATYTDVPWYPHREEIKKVVFEGGVSAGSMGYMFYECSNLEAFEGLAALDVSRAKSMNSLFSGCSSLASLDLSGWETSSVTDMKFMFDDCASIRSLDVSMLDTSSVSSTWAMFNGCASLLSLDLSSFDMSSVKSARHMFNGCSALSSINVADWDVSSVTDFTCMFGGCVSLKELDLSRWKTSSATDMTSVFTGCTSLESLDLSGWDTVSVTSMRHIFNKCSSLEKVNLSGWDTSEVDNVNYVFLGCSSISEITLGSKFVLSDDMSLRGISADKVWRAVGSGELYDTTAVLREGHNAVGKEETYALLTYADEPVAESLVYNGSEQVGVKDTEGYSLSGRVSAVDAGSYTAAAKLDDGYIWPDDSFEPKTLNWSISKAVFDTSQITFTDATVVYDGKPHELVISGSLPAGASVSYSGNGQTSVGSYEVIASFDGGTNYESMASKKAVLNITPATLTASYAGEAIGWDETPGLQITVEGFVDGEDETTADGYVAPKISAPSSLEHGKSYVLTPAGGSATNYSFEYESGTLSVGLKPVEAPEANASLVYTAASQTGILPGDGYSLSGDVQAVNAGSYEATATLLEGFVWADGTTEPKDITWSISKAKPELSVGVMDVSLVYGESTSVSWSYVGDGEVTVSSSNESVASIFAGEGAFTVAALSEGETTIVLSASEGSNYLASETVIIPVTVGVVDMSDCTLKAEECLYTGAPYAGSIEVFDPSERTMDPDGYEICFYSDSACTEAVTASDVKAAGVYYVIATGAREGKIEGSTAPVEVKISPATLVAKYKGESIRDVSEFDGIVEVTGFVGGENPETTAGYVAPSVSLPETLVRGNDYVLSPKGGAADNYVFDYRSGAFSYDYRVAVKPSSAGVLKYTGASQVGVPTGTGYTLSGDASATDAGEYSVTAVLLNDYAWADGTRKTVELSWAISPVSIEDDVVCQPLPDQVNTGSAITPSVTLTYGDMQLAEGTDYVLSYDNNVHQGVASVVIAGQGNYEGEKLVSFSIVGISLDGASVEPIPDCAYTGEAIEPSLVVKLGDVQLQEDVDYKVTFANNVDAGVATASIAGIGLYSGSKTVTYSIVPTSIEGAAIAPIAGQVYTGEAIEPTVEVHLEGFELVAGVDYDVLYTNNVQPGQASVTIVGKGNFTGQAITEFHIGRYDIAKAHANVFDNPVLLRNGEAKPKVTVLAEDRASSLREGEDYAVEFVNATELGEAKAVLTGIGEYCGTLEVGYTVVDSIDISDGYDFAFCDGDMYFYTGSPIEPKVCRTQNPDAFVLNRDYEVTYKNNTNKGTATAVIQGIGDYSGTVELDFVIVDKSNFTMNDVEVTLRGNDVFVGGDVWLLKNGSVEPEVLVRVSTEYGTKTLKEGENYTVSYSNNKRAGVGYVTLTGANGINGEKKVSFRIASSANIANSSNVALMQYEYRYTGSPIRPELLPSEKLVAGEDYVLTYEDNVQVGTGKVIVRGMGVYTGALTLEFKIVEDSSFTLLSDCNVEKMPFGVYTGSAVEPDFKLIDPHSGRPLLSWYEYRHSFLNNVDAGTATIVITSSPFQSAYAGARLIEFPIAPANMSEVDFLPVESQDFTGSAVKPALDLAYNGMQLVEGVDYELTYEDNVEIGLAKVVAKGMGNYTGMMEVPFEIVMPDEAAVDRIWGDYARDTAAAISEEAFSSDEGSEWVVIARDDDFRDAMSATGLAGALGCPILLTDRYGLSAAAADEIKRLGATRAYIIGGKGAVPGDLESALAALDCMAEPRVYGNASYDTSVKCAELIAALNEADGVEAAPVIVAYGQNFQDALSMSSFAYSQRSPIFLQTFGATAAERGLTQEAVGLVNSRFADSRIFVAGGAGAVSNASVASIGFSEAKGDVRLWGNDGYETSLAIAEYMVENGYLEPGVVVVASGAQAPKGLDALAGAALAGLHRGVMLLANGQASFGSVNTSAVDSFLAAYSSGVSSAYVLGGAYVMPEDVIMDRIRDALGIEA